MAAVKTNIFIICYHNSWNFQLLFHSVGNFTFLYLSVSIKVIGTLLKSFKKNEYFHQILELENKIWVT